MNQLNLSALAVRERSITLFLIIAITLAGVFSFFELGRAEDPMFTVKVLTVSVAWPGATPKEMQNLVAEPLEKRLQELRWYDRVETVTRPGMALMTLTLKSSMPPSELAQQFYQARKKLDDEAKSLPSGVLGPFINDEYSDVTFALYALKANSLPMRLLSRQAEGVRQQLLHVPGVKKVNILGEQPERIFVEFSYARLANLGISPTAIFSALQSANQLTPAGAIETDDRKVFVRLDGAYHRLEDIGNTVIAGKGFTFKLKDIASIKRGYEDPATFKIRDNGEPSILLGVVMREGGNELALGEALNKAFSSIREQLPSGVEVSKISEQAVNIDNAFSEFMLKFVVAISVVMLVSLLSMGWRVGIIVVAAVPLTLAAVFTIMLLTDRQFDRITLGALILSLGLLVDDAIIAIETMVVKMEEGMSRVKAAAYSWSHTASPMLSGTLITIIGFTPVGFAQSSAGEYAGNIFWIVGFALIASWVVAVVFTPYIGVKLLPNIEPVSGGHEAIYATKNYQILRNVVQWVVKYKRLVSGAVLLLFVVSALGMLFVQQQFFPNSDRPELLVELQMQEGSSFALTDKTAQKVESWLKLQPEAKVVTAYIGQGAPRFFLSYNPELPDPAFAKIIILTANDNQRDRLKLKLRKAIQAGLAFEAQIRVSQLVFGPYTPYPVEFRVMGPDPDKLRVISNQVAEIMRSNKNMRTVNHNWGEKQPKADFVVDKERLRQLGMSMSEVSEQLQLLISGMTITNMREDIRNVGIVARTAGHEKWDPTLFQDFNVVNADGKSIPLSQIGHVEFGSEDPVLMRRNRTPIITVRGDVAENVQPHQVSSEVKEALSPLISQLPNGYVIEEGGIIEESNMANNALLPIFPIMIGLTLLIIMLQVRSFAAMLMVYLTAPLGLIGAVPTLLLFNQPFGFTAILGLIGLSGILMRNTLILIQQIKDNLSSGMSQHTALIEATVQRSRPVILTALAAVLAFIPLTYSTFWGPMAYTLIGGTAIGTVLTLLFLPALYAIWFKVGNSQ
ncbi:efflux RND transporter permease subunit [uncultured Shewanella sp.]|uniref:efflux RND transporter permease subunit n=1 Tax=uncultured Shewanella sp. TaxID=173975 RepID=UPI00262FDC97|nr:efflux RND transporter permease subunit [uncultured Shewanella sp.]